ncbi:Phosphoribosylaminoimidazole carboxylase, chloroplastic (Fragment) [Linum perenne]
MLQRIVPNTFHSFAAASDFSSLKPSFFPPSTAQSLAMDKFPLHSSFASTPLSLQNQSHPRQNQVARASQDSIASTTRGDEVVAVHGVSETVVGVLGGGQLGRMLCQSGSEMAIKVIVLDPLEGCPASSIAHDHMVGSFDDSATVEEFAKRCGVLTVEIEHVDVATMERLEQQGVDCQPKASTIRIIQDKYLQKVHFSRHGIPLPEFMQIDDLEGAKRAGDLFGYPLMIKSKRLAYDGRGNAVAKSEDELSSAVESLGGFHRGLYVEKWAPFVKELAVIVARGRDNAIVCYPVVETIHKENICHIVKAPAVVPWKIRQLATDVARKAVSSLEGAGVFAVELFLTSDGQILLNEVAPRPHNSGHHTIEACYTSQFEQHLRAVLGLPLGDPSMKAPAAIMYNLLGEEEGDRGFYLAHQLIGKALTVPGANVHWYDKPEMRKQRKMGHVTIVGPSMGTVEARMNSMLKEQGSDDQSVAITPRVGIIMGSDSDLPVMKDASRILTMFGVPHEVRIVSAHRTPELMCSYASSARDKGMVASLTPLPVIGVPVRSSSLDGMDSLLSIVQMPRGVPVATVAINNATNAGLLAVRILGAGDPDLLARMSQYQDDTRNEVLKKAEKLESEGWESYLNP